MPNGFNDSGSPTNVTFFARPFGEMELLAFAKAYQDAAGFHLKKPTKLESAATTAGSRSSSTSQSNCSGLPSPA